MKMAVETIEVKIPKELLLEMEEKKLVEDMKLFTAMKFYEKGMLSLGKAAKFAAKNKDEFMEALSGHGIDVIRYSKEELDVEIKFLKKAK